MYLTEKKDLSLVLLVKLQILLVFHWTGCIKSLFVNGAIKCILLLYHGNIKSLLNPTE